MCVRFLLCFAWFYLELFCVGCFSSSTQKIILHNNKNFFGGKLEKINSQNNRISEHLVFLAFFKSSVETFIDNRKQHVNLFFVYENFSKF